MGQGSRLAAATGAYICFEDEAGQNLRPPKARTWGRRGHPPVVRMSGKGSGRVSMAGMVCLKPGHRGHLFFWLRIHRAAKASAAVIRNRLRRIQYRPELFLGLLAQTGLTLNLRNPQTLTIQDL